MSHGGAFRKFYGLSTLKPTRRISGPTYRGPACLYKDHSPLETSVCWRDSRTHACQQCVERIEEHVFGLRLDRFSESVRKRALKFWSYVDITTFDDCWQWTKELNHNQLYFFWKRPELRNRYQWHPIAIAVWLSWGDTGRLGTESICGNRRCVNPLHNLPKDLLPSVNKADYDDSWLLAELNSLKHEVSSFLQSQDSAASAKSKYFIPSSNQNSAEIAEYDNSLDIHNYHLAINSLKQQIMKGQHPMQQLSE